jgi:hypothetical protein
MRRAWRFLPPALAAAVAIALLPPSALLGFSTLGWSLDFGQRDVRVFNNFQDPEANDNQTRHPNWPGYTGAELAIWKAVSEWGSSLHGDGTGDPSQPGDLGSGAAAFDVTWQGNAPDIGASTGNVVSATSSAGGGVVAVAEYGANGWRIRLNDQLLWDDGPGTVLAPGAFDIQGTIAHEYGHALGLGHSSVPGSTMYGAAVGNGVSARSIEADDIAGIQAVYGTPSALKPWIGAASGGNPVVIDGFAFSPTDNEVWFTRAGVNPTGEPLKLTGVSSNGTQIVVAFPVGAGPGDVLVMNSWGRLSNAYPFDTSGCTPPVSYCTAGTTASGCTAALSALGTPSASSPSGFVLQCVGSEGGKQGLFYFGTNGRQANPWGNGSSYQCVAPPVSRTPLRPGLGTSGACDGLFLYDLNFHWNAFKPSSNPGAGALVQVQAWFRDPQNTSNQTTSLSDALELSVCP